MLITFAPSILKLRTPKFDLTLLVRITQLALPVRSLFVGAVVLTIVQSTLTAVQPLLYRHTIDNFIMKADVPGITRWSAIILGLLLLQTALGFANSYMAEYIGQNVIFRLRDYVYKHLVSLRQSFYDKTAVGTAVTRTISDIETITELFSAGLITIAGDVFQILVILICMLWMNWKMTLISLSVLPLLIWAANKFRKGVRDSFQEVRNEVARLNAFLQEHITGMQIVQLFNRQEAEAEKFKTINAKHRDANIRGIFYYAVFFPIVDLIVAATLGLIVWYGSAGLLQHTVQPGEITAFIMFINLFFRPVRAIADRFNNIQMGMIAADRIFKLIDDAGNIETGGDVDQAKLKGDIEFKNVWFAYEEENWVIRDLSFTLNAGKTLAIVGHTGSGKTTITSLLSRFYDNQKGDILIDALPVQKYSLKTLRSNIAVVLQDVFLFSGSIAENITLKNQTVDMDAMKEAARKIGAYDFIEKLPGGFDFNVMERGLSLSLGQRQLISFIRALVLNPAILVLDEASSSVDTETELMIQKALDVLLTDRTAIVIAHRLSTIRHADAIMVMDKGAVTEFGNHESLLAENGQYAKLYHQQFERRTETV